ncbi:11647_t:CDS:2 [Racocetra persica]|uniref:11647_t:CDS:1 n=1 Tax=Racocetra persica TaxID=160502 RepID=A0ACA9N8N7_9GLOM|nr:11647_t:CDS:2 [Racocetra persica]
MDTVDQHIESNVLLDNNEVETIISNLLDEKEILDDEGIISMVQAKKNNDKPTEQKIEEEDEDKVPEPLVIVAEVYSTMQTVIRYKEQENSESNLLLDELGFLRKLLKEYKHVYEKSKKQLKITSFFTFPDSYSNSSYLQDSYPYDLYSQDSYPYNLYSQDLYLQDSYFYNSHSSDLSS